VGSKLAVLAGHLIALAIGVGTAAAQTPAPQGPPDLFKQGVEAYKAGRYDEAAGLLGKAYALDPKPEMLFPLAQAERLGGHCPAAIIHYKKLLESLTDLTTAKLVQNNVALCEQTESVDTKPKHVDVTPPPPPPPPKTIVKVENHTDIVSLLLVAGGTLSIGTSVGFYIAANGARDDAAHARTLDDHNSFEDRANLDRGLSITTAVVGVGLVGFAVYRWVKGGGEQAPATVSIAPTAGGTTVSVFARW
jgi:hypothetical protein